MFWFLSKSYLSICKPCIPVHFSENSMLEFSFWKKTHHPCFFLLGLPNTFGGYDETPKVTATHLKVSFLTSKLFIFLKNTITKGTFSLTFIRSEIHLHKALIFVVAQKQSARAYKVTEFTTQSWLHKLIKWLILRTKSDLSWFSHCI